MPAGIKIMEREVNFIVQKLSPQPLAIQVSDAQDSLMTRDLPSDNNWTKKVLGSLIKIVVFVSFSPHYIANQFCAQALKFMSSMVVVERSKNVIVLRELKLWPHCTGVHE